MSSGIVVTDFKYIKGQNDAEYIKLLERHIEGLKSINSKAIAKIKEQDARIKELENETAEIQYSYTHRGRAIR